MPSIHGRQVRWYDPVTGRQLTRVKRLSLGIRLTYFHGISLRPEAPLPDAKRIEHLTYNQVIDKRLGIMDLSAVDLCQRSGIPIVVLNLRQAGNMAAVVQGKGVGTLINAG